MTMIATCCAPPPSRYARKAAALMELRPCPFCGSTRIVFDEYSTNVECWDCSATGPQISRFLDQADGDWTMAAILSWNTRADDPNEEDEA